MKALNVWKKTQTQELCANVTDGARKFSTLSIIVFRFSNDLFILSSSLQSESYKQQDL